MGRHSCCVKQKLRKGLWSPEEDEKLFNYITRFGVGCWSSVPKLAGLQRCGKSCRLRWVNYLRPDLKRGMFSQQEEDLILRLHEVLGNRWAQIAVQLPGRTDNEIKNFWNSCLKKKLLKQGIDPNTHRPVTESEARQQKINCTDKASLQITLPNSLPHSSSETDKAIQMNSQSYYFGGEIEASSYQQPVSKQVFDPLFLLEFQKSIDPYNQTEFEGDPNHAFNSLPTLTNLEHRNIADSDFSDTSTSRMSSFLINERKESSSNRSNPNYRPAIKMNNMVENASAFSWDYGSKFDSVFQYQFNGIKTEEDVKPSPWQEGQLQTQNSGDFSNYPLTSLSAEDLSRANLDVFHQI